VAAQASRRSSLTQGLYASCFRFLNKVKCDRPHQLAV
jgi:hypothetical protein